jgi:hypothetical protein
MHRQGTHELSTIISGKRRHLSTRHGTGEANDVEEVVT